MLRRHRQAGIVDMSLGTLPSRHAQCSPHPRPCLCGSLHVGHCSWYHGTLSEDGTVGLQCGLYGDYGQCEEVTVLFSFQV